MCSLIMFLWYFLAFFLSLPCKPRSSRSFLAPLPNVIFGGSPLGPFFARLKSSRVSRSSSSLDSISNRRERAGTKSSMDSGLRLELG